MTERVDNGGAFGALINLLQIVCLVTTVHVRCTQTALLMHENAPMVLRTQSRTTYYPSTQTIML